MSFKKCPLCNQSFFPSQKIVRIMVELASKDKGDGDDPERWSNVHDWDVVQKFHFSCVKKAFDDNMTFEHEQIVALLPIDDLYKNLRNENKPKEVPYLKLVEGGSK